jgi:hypothetical protein
MLLADQLKRQIIQGTVGTPLTVKATDLPTRDLEASVAITTSAILNFRHLGRSRPFGLPKSAYGWILRAT